MSSVKTLLNTSIGLKKRYLLQSIMGTTELAVVFEALDDKQNVIVKYYQNTDHEFKELLQKAIKYQMQFKDHAQKVVPIHEFGITGDGHLWLMMEHQSPAQNLKNWYQESKNQTIGATLHILYQLAEILKIVHQNGQPHGNIKPTNLFVGNGDQLRISDMGGVGLYGVHKKEKVRTVINDPSFFSPEQANGKEINLYSDFFGLGVIGYFLLTGDLPFTGTTSDKILTNIIVTTPKINVNQIKDQSKPNETLELVELLNQCLSKNLGNRPQSLQKVIDQLEALSKKIPHVVKSSTSTAVGMGGFSRQTASYQIRDIESALQGNHAGLGATTNHSTTASTSWASTTGSNTSGSRTKVTPTKTTTGSWASISSSSSLNEQNAPVVNQNQDWASTSTPNASATNQVNTSWSNAKPQFKTGSWSSSKFSTGSWSMPNLTPPIIPPSPNELNAQTNLNDQTNGSNAQDLAFKTSIGTPAINPFANLDLNQMNQQENWQKVIEAIPEPKPIPIQDSIPEVKAPEVKAPEVKAPLSLAKPIIQGTSDWGSLVDDFVVPENTPPENPMGVDSVDQSLNAMVNDMIDQFDDSVVDLADHANWDEATPTDDLEHHEQAENTDFQQSSYQSDFDLGDLIEDALEEVEGHTTSNQDAHHVQNQIKSMSTSYDELLKENLSPIYEDGRVTNPIPLTPDVIQAEPQVFSTEYDRIPSHLLDELKSLSIQDVPSVQDQSINVANHHANLDLSKVQLTPVPVIEPLIKAGANQPEHLLNILMNVPLQLKGHLLTFSHFQLPIEDAALDSGYFPVQANDHSMMANYLGSQIGFDFSKQIEKTQEMTIENDFISPQEQQKSKKMIIEILLAVILLGIGIFFGMHTFKSTDDQNDPNPSKIRSFSPTTIQPENLNQPQTQPQTQPAQKSIDLNNQPSEDLEIEDIKIEEPTKVQTPKQSTVEIPQVVPTQKIPKLKNNSTTSTTPKTTTPKTTTPKTTTPKTTTPKTTTPKTTTPKTTTPKTKPKEEKNSEIESPF